MAAASIVQPEEDGDALHQTFYEPDEDTEEESPDEDLDEPEPSEPPPVAKVDLSRLTAKELRIIKEQMIAASIEEYDGPCPCPYNTMRNGRACGGRSAYSRPGGEEPLCYEKDITVEMVREFVEGN